jgi:hypothetical protein
MNIKQILTLEIPHFWQLTVIYGFAVWANRNWKSELATKVPNGNYKLIMYKQLPAGSTSTNIKCYFVHVLLVKSFLRTVLVQVPGNPCVLRSKYQVVIKNEKGMPAGNNDTLLST